MQMRSKMPVPELWLLVKVGKSERMCWFILGIQMCKTHLNNDIILNKNEFSNGW